MTNKTALVTGGGRGIGLGISLKLAEEKWNLAISGKREVSAVRKTIEKLMAFGTKVRYYQSDVSRGLDREQLITSIRNDFGGLNLLVNNAGAAPLKRFDILKADEESFDRLMNINLKGPYFLTRDVANWMIEQRSENREEAFSIINIGSISSEVASPSRGDYCLSKAGISMATKLWATRLGEYNISVFEIQPGITKTDMTEAVKEKYDKLISEGLLLFARWGLPADMGKAVASLGRGDWSYSTGHTFRIDGGLTVARL